LTIPLDYDLIVIVRNKSQLEGNQMTAQTTKDSEKIQEQIDLAKYAIKKHGHTVAAVVNVFKLKPNARKKYFGFNFDQTKSVGDKWTDEYGVSFEAVAIVSP
jgi:hypothetical protein